MHLLAHIPTPDYAPWKTAFDAHAEDRDASGLTLLQFWRGADDPNAVTALFECHDRARAQGWLDRQRGLGAAIDARFVRTA